MTAVIITDTLDIEVAMSKDTRVLGLRRDPPKIGGVCEILSPSSVREIELKYQIAVMRRDGWTVEDIATSLCCGKETVMRYLRNTLTETIEKYMETTEEARQLQLERLDALVKVYTPMAHGHHELQHDSNSTDPKAMVEVWVPPNQNAAILLLNIEQRRAKLLALDVPETKKLELTAIREYIGVSVDDV